jgi:hypothetical protein
VIGFTNEVKKQTISRLGSSRDSGASEPRHFGSLPALLDISPARPAKCGRPGRARSSAGEHTLHTGGVTGSIPVAPTILSALSISSAAAGLALCCTVWVGNAQAANLLATENGDTTVLTPDANWDRAPFTSSGSGESVDGSGAFLANSTATGSALVVLTEGPGGANSDWLELVYSGAGGSGTETVTAQ